MSYHIDEHIGHAISMGLRRRGINVTTTPETGLIGVSDALQIEYAFRAGRVVFTQ